MSSKLTSIKNKLKAKDRQAEKSKQKKYESAFVNLRPMMGYFNWAEFLFLIGGAQAGKSYAIIDFFVSQFVNNGTPFYWFRLTERQSRQLLNNKAEKLIDPDIRRRYNLDLETSGTNVYAVKREEYEVKKKNGTVEIKTKIVEKKLMARVLALSTFYADKGSGYFDKDYKGWYNIGLDEFQPEANEHKTFDIVYAFVRQMENMVRNTKTHVRVIAAANLLEEAADLLCAFNFIPEQFGTYKLKSKRCVISYIEPNEKYKEMRKGSIADILLPNASMYSNKQNTDTTLIDKSRLVTPNYVIKFSKDQKDWYTIWNGNIITKYNGEKKPVISMRPYLDEVYQVDMVNNIITLFNTRSFKYRNLITFKQFQTQIELLKPSK